MGADSHAGGLHLLLRRILQLVGEQSRMYSYFNRYPDIGIGGDKNVPHSSSLHRAEDVAQPTPTRNIIPCTDNRSISIH